MLMFVFTDLCLFTHFATFLILGIPNISLSSEMDMKQLQYRGKIIAKHFMYLFCEWNV